MATNGNRGRGRGGGPGGGGNRGGDPGSRRGSWRAGPPGSASYNNNNNPRTGTPSNGNGQGAGTPPTGPRQSINDHMNDMKRAQQDKSAKTFQTDTEISSTNNANKPRELQRWQADPAVADSTSSPGSASGAAGVSNGNGSGNGEPRPNGKNAQDAETFGAAGGKWDQFETNSRLFGTQTSYQEELYTTKLNKSGADFKAREKEAEKLAAEIMGQTSGNFHILEERGAEVSWADDVDEEEKYSGVARNPNAYVPPGARRGGYAAAAGRTAASTPVLAPKPNGQVPLNGNKTPLVPLGSGKGAAGGTRSPQPAVSNKDAKPAQSAATAPAPAPAAAPKKAPSPAPTSTDKVPAPVAEKKAEDAVAPLAVPGAATGGDAAAATLSSPVPPALALSPSAAADGTDPSQLTSVVGAYRQFVDNEREKVVAKKQSIAKSEREKQLADLKKFQASFKVPLPIPKDILPILSKDEEKQKAIEAQAESSLKAARDAATASTSKKADVKSPDMGKKQSKKIQMSIAEIPPFNPNKMKPSPANQPLPIPESAKADISIGGKSPAVDAGALPAASPGAAKSTGTASAQSGPSASKDKAADSSLAKLNPKASAFVFKPNANAPAFKPGQPSSPAAVVARLTSPAVPLNPFFGDDMPKTDQNIRSDFNPFKPARGQLPMANTIPPIWPYNGRPVQISFFQTGPPGSYMVQEDENNPYARAGPMSGPMQGMHPGMRYSQSGMPNMNMQANQLYPPGHGGPIPPGNGFAQMQGGMPMGGYPQQFMGPQGMYLGNGNGNPNGIQQNGMPGPPNGLAGPNGPHGSNGPNPNGSGPAQFMSPQLSQQSGPPGHFAGPASPTNRSMSMHHQQMQSMGGPGGPIFPFQHQHQAHQPLHHQHQQHPGHGQGRGAGMGEMGQHAHPNAHGMHGHQGPGSASASSQGHGHPGGPGSQIGTPMQTPQMQHSNVYSVQTPFQQPSPVPPSIPQMPHA